MEIAVFGATGGTGRQFVRQARGRGHTVRALVRPTAADLPDVEQVTGDVLDPAAVRRTLDGVDAVVCILGLPKSEGTSVSDGTATIIREMATIGLRRLAVVTVQGLNDSKARAGFFGKVVIPLFLRSRMADRARQEDVVFASDLEYTVVRPSRLVDGEASTTYHMAPDLRTGMSASTRRADLAAALLDLVEGGSFVRQAVTVVS